MKGNEIKVFIAIVLFISVLSVILIVFSKKPEKKEEFHVSEMDFSEHLSYEDFMIPDDYKLNFQQGIIQYRQEHERWSWAQIEDYWEDPEKLALEYIESENEKTLEEIFEKVP